MVEYVHILCVKPIVKLLGLVVQEEAGNIEMVTVAAQDHKQVKKQLLAVLVDNWPTVVQTKEDDVKHQVHVDAPVHTVAIEVKSINHKVSQEDDSQVASVEGGYGETGVRQELRERSKPAAKLWHWKRMRKLLVSRVQLYRI